MRLTNKTCKAYAEDMHAAHPELNPFTRRETHQPMIDCTPLFAATSQELLSTGCTLFCNSLIQETDCSKQHR